MTDVKPFAALNLLPACDFSDSQAYDPDSALLYACKILLSGSAGSTQQGPALIKPVNCWIWASISVDISQPLHIGFGASMWTFHTFRFISTAQLAFQNRAAITTK